LFLFYLEDQLIYVGQTEKMDEAITEIGKLFNKKPKSISEEGRNNLLRLLEDEYKFLEERFGIVYDK